MMLQRLQTYSDNPIIREGLIELLSSLLPGVLKTIPNTINLYNLTILRLISYLKDKLIERRKGGAKTNTMTMIKNSFFFLTKFHFCWPRERKAKVNFAETDKWIPKKVIFD